MVKGWHFGWDEVHYWVGARDSREAKITMRRYDEELAKLEPAEIPSDVVRFLALADGKVVTGRVLAPGRP